MKPKLAFVLGIRPDVIRAALILKHLRSQTDFDVVFIWSGQHYSENMKGVFFRELGVDAAEVDLGCKGDTDAEVVASVISRLHKALFDIKPMAVVFLGDTNTTTGALAAAQLNIPIVHIEGCMRSYDWRMPEEKYRTTIDHLSDVIYTYFDEYKAQGVREGLNPQNIVVVGNPIVDILQHYYFNEKAKFEKMACNDFFSKRGLKRNEYFLMTCHRRENVHDRNSLAAIIKLAESAPYPVYFPASYRTQKLLTEFKIHRPPNLMLVDPIGYEEILCLIVNSRGVLTDSGTVVEETCVLQVPSVQMRHSTERPQVYDVKSSVKFDPSRPDRYPPDVIFAKLESLFGTKWSHNLGDGNASQKIANDLARRVRENDFMRHKPEMYHFSIERSYTEDDVKKAG